MSIDRVATATNRTISCRRSRTPAARWNTTQQQIASGDNATTYAGFGTQTQVLTATMSANARNSAYHTATIACLTQARLQDTQLTSLSGLASQLQHGDQRLPFRPTMTPRP